MSAPEAVEAAARQSYGRLVAILAARSRDIAAAEDALSEALVSALRLWPRTGVPANPEGWLMTAARNRLKNAARHAQVAGRALPDLVSVPEEGADLPDPRLALLFVCAHPAIDPAARTPLMLQTVLGLDAARIAAAFLTPPATMSQRLVRAKARIRDTGLRFAPPAREDMPDRLPAVLDAIYAAYGRGWDDLSGNDDLTEEAIYLARLLNTLLPEEPEAKGLLALMLYTHARRPARRDTEGRFVPLTSQDSRLWSRTLIIEAEGLLTAAAAHASFGRYQCEAAIQSVHIQRPITGRTNHAVLLTLYDLLIQHSPGLGARISRAVVLAEAGDPAAALVALDALPPDRVAQHQPYWTARAKVLTLLARPEAARQARDKALSLTAEPALRDWLLASYP